MGTTGGTTLLTYSEDAILQVMKVKERNALQATTDLLNRNDRRRNGFHQILDRHLIATIVEIELVSISTTVAILIVTIATKKKIGVSI